MSSIFSSESPAMRFLAKLADLMVLNLLFIVTSLPLVTLGASLTALNATAIALVTDRYESVAATYLTSWRSNARQGSLLGLAVVGVAAVLGAWYVVVDNAAVPAVARLVLLALLILASYRFLGTAVFVFAYQATFADSVGRVLGNARRMSARHPLSTFMVLLVTVLPFVVGVYYPQMFVWGVVWVAFGFSGIAFVNAVLLVNVFTKYGLKVMNP